MSDTPKDEFPKVAIYNVVDGDAYIAVTHKGERKVLRQSRTVILGGGHRTPVGETEFKAPSAQFRSFVTGTKNEPR